MDYHEDEEADHLEKGVDLLRVGWTSWGRRSWCLHFHIRDFSIIHLEKLENATGIKKYLILIEFGAKQGFKLQFEIFQKIIIVACLTY